MSCPMNCVSASWPCTWFTRNWSLMCILLKSPVRSWTVTSVTRPTIFVGSSAGVSPSGCLLNMSGARMLYHAFAFHLSLILRAAARDFFSAMRAARKGVAYLRVLGRRAVLARASPDQPEDDCHADYQSRRTSNENQRERVRRGRQHDHEHGRVCRQEA